MTGGEKLLMIKLTAQQLKDKLESSGIYKAKGNITMTLNGTSVQIKSTDTIGNNIQEWLSQWLSDNKIYFRTPDNTQNFPDFYLSESNDKDLLEVKSYFAPRRPAFDVANFDSYWKALSENPSKLDADYLIFAYDLVDGVLSIRNIYLKKVWEITGRATDYPLNCQRKNGQIYNIRPISFHSPHAAIPAFNCKEEFLAALYKTVLGHTNKATDTRDWLKKVLKGYKKFSGIDLTVSVEKYLRS